MQRQIRIFKRHLRLAVFVPLTLAVVLGGILVLETSYLVNSMQKVEHSYRVQMLSRSLLKMVLDMETGLRGFLLTGEEHFLQPYRDNARQFGPTVEELKKLTAADPKQREMVEEFEDLYDTWHEHSTEMIERKERGESVADVTLNLQGKRIMDEIRSRRDELLQTEENRLQSHIARVRWMLTSIFATAIVLSLVFGLMIARFSRRAFSAVANTYDSALRTSQERAEELHQSQSWLAAVLGSIGDGVIATDNAGNMVFSNPVSRQILGLAEEEIRRTRTKDAIRIVDEYSQEPIRDPFEQVTRSHAPIFSDGHLTLQRKDGSTLPVALQAFPIRDGEQINGAVIVLRDITEQRQSERTLQSAEKLASIGRIAASVAHEIHNPLDALGNLLYLIEHGEALSEANQTYVRLAREELERITSISEQMLTFSRETRQPVEVNLQDVLENVLTLYAARMRRMGVVVVRNFGAKTMVKAFPGEMRQVFSNLIGNALDAMNGPGKLVLRISETRDWREDGATAVRVLVCDSGPGIPEEVRDKLMEPFVTSKGEKGTGLGLWVCRGIVEKYHGQLRYFTTTKRAHSGTCFSVLLPGVPSGKEARSENKISEPRAS